MDMINLKLAFHWMYTRLQAACLESCRIHLYQLNCAVVRDMADLLTLGQQCKSQQQQQQQQLMVTDYQHMMLALYPDMPCC